MTVTVAMSRRIVAAAHAADRLLLGVSPRLQRGAIALTLAAMAVAALHNVPRAYLDFRSLPLLRNVPQPEEYGSDTIADMYEARVVLNDPRDMYTKRRVEQTALEARTWSKEASAPYPPATLLIQAALLAVGERAGIGFYGLIAILAVVWLALSAAYCLRTRWYLFPLLYLNVPFLAYRFFYVQDGSYLIMLVTVMMALLLARHGRRGSHALMGLAIAQKLSPIYYACNVTAMPRRTAMLFVAIVGAGLLLPVFVLDNYLYIFTFHEQFKGGRSETIAAFLVSIPFAVVLRYVETRMRFDLEDRIGWGLVPAALFLGLKMNTARHLLLALLVPDKRGVRSAAAGVALAMPMLFPGLVRVNSALLIATGLLAIGLVYYLDGIGWDVVRADVRQPLATARMLVLGRSPQDAGVWRA